MWTSIALIVIAFTTGVATRTLVAEFKTCDTEFNSDIMQNVTIALITVGNRKVLNGSLIHQIEIPSFDVTTLMTLPQGRTRNVTYLNLTMNGCEFIAQPFANSVSFTGFLLNTLRKSITNLPKRCPIKKFSEMVVSNLYGDTDLMPFPISPTRFDFTIIVTVQSTMAYRVHIAGTLGEKRKKLG